MSMIGEVVSFVTCPDGKCQSTFVGLNRFQLYKYLYPKTTMKTERSLFLVLDQAGHGFPRRVFNHDPSDRQLSRGQTPLHWAASKGHIKVVELLLKSGAPVEKADKFGRGPGAEWFRQNGLGGDQVSSPHRRTTKQKV